MYYDGLSLDPRYCLEPKDWDIINKALTQGGKAQITVDVVKPFIKQIPEKALKTKWFERVPWTALLLISGGSLVFGGFIGFAVGFGLAK